MSIEKLRAMGLRIAKAREAKNISAYQLSKHIRKHISYIQKVEAGSVNISYLVILDICKVIGIHPKELFE